MVGMKQVTLEVLTSPGCAPCHDFLDYWKTIAGEWTNVSMEECSLSTSEGMTLAAKHRVFAVPAGILNGTLFASGAIDTRSFVASLSDLSE